MQIPAAVVAAIWQRVEREGRSVHQQEFPDGAAPGIDLYASIGRGYVLRSDGSVFEWGDDLGRDMTLKLRLADQRSALQGLVLSLKLFPEVASALPTRPAVWRDCGGCGGHGFLDLGDRPRFLLCEECNGLGWQAA